MLLNSSADVTNTLRNHSNAVDTFAIANCALNVLLVPIAIVGNALVLGAIIRTTSLHSPSMVFIGNLAITDLIVGLMIQPLYSTSILLTDVPILKTVVEITAYPMCGVSLCTLTVISVDRFMALHYHMQYSTLLTTVSSCTYRSDYILHHLSRKRHFILFEQNCVFIRRRLRHLSLFSNINHFLHPNLSNRSST